MMAAASVKTNSDAELEKLFGSGSISQAKKEEKLETKPGKEENETKLSDTQLYAGYNLFPERRSNTWNEGLTKGGRHNYDKMKCERKVYEAVQKNPLVKLMLSALKSAGCEFDLRRHLNCEYCEHPVTGGYDPEFNQIVICQNSAKSSGIIQGVLVHELIHMFDHCRAELDFQNIRHLACTEVRAANLTHCSFISAMADGKASPFNIAKRHGECVKAKATTSVVAVRKVTAEEARAVVDSVFDKCYKDLEPIGRRIRRNSRHPDQCYFERHHYGYGD